MPEQSEVPLGSRIADFVPNSYFHDAWRVQVREPGLTALEYFLMAARATPSWVNACMALRNKAVGLFGIKNLGGLHHIDLSKKASEYRVGDRVGIFTLFEHGVEESLLGDRDKHLDVMLSVHRSVVDSMDFVTITTIVNVHNALGKLYMIPVTPMHRIIVPSVMRSIDSKPTASSKTGSW